MYLIYSLINPLTQEIFYIGCTSDTRLRLNNHVHEGIKSQRPIKTPKEQYIFNLLLNNVHPIINPIKYADSKEEALLYEEKYIHLYSSFGHNLCNVYKNSKCKKRNKYIV